MYILENHYKVHQNGIVLVELSKERFNLKEQVFIAVRIFPQTNLLLLTMNISAFLRIRKGIRVIQQQR